MSDASTPPCLYCGYSLHGLTESRCPECGQEFDPIYVSQFESRRVLLPWERPEVGGVIKRTLKTAWAACVHPRRFFAVMASRQARPIARPGSFIIACVIGSISIHVLSILLTHFFEVIFLAIKGRNFGRALQIRTTTLLHGLRIDWLFPSIDILSWLVGLSLTCTVIYFSFGKRRSTLRFVEIMAVLSPVFVVSALTYAAGMFVIMLSRYTLMSLAYAMGIAPVVVFVVTLWHFCRQALKARRFETAGLILICLVVSHYAEWPVPYILGRLALIILPAT